MTGSATPHVAHIVWDWNGTLFDDGHLVLDAANACLAAIGCAPVDLETYQRAYCRPVRDTYTTLAGRTLTDAEWHEIDDHFHDHYLAAMSDAALHNEAHAAMDLADEAGLSQSLLSGWRHDLLVPCITELGLTGRFTRVDGLRGPGGTLKAGPLRDHLDAIGYPGTRVTLIGDTLDDAAAAAANGAGIVLFDGGAHTLEQLTETGNVVAAGLIEAVRRAQDAPRTS